MFPRASNVVLSNILSFSCERAPGMVGDVGGNCWATWVNFPNLPKTFRHLGNILSGFFSKLPSIFGYHRKLLIIFPWDFGQQLNFFSTSIVCAWNYQVALQFPNCLNFLDHLEFSIVPKIFGQKWDLSNLSTPNIFEQKWDLQNLFQKKIKKTRRGNSKNGLYSCMPFFEMTREIFRSVSVPSKYTFRKISKVLMGLIKVIFLQVFF